MIQGLEALQCPAVLVGQALANFEATEWTKKNILQVNSVPWRTQESSLDEEFFSERWISTQMHLVGLLMQWRGSSES